MKKFVHLEDGIDTWDDFNNDYKLRVDAHKTDWRGITAPPATSRQMRKSTFSSN